MKTVIEQSELFDIAKCKQKLRLINWLNQNGIRFMKTATGEVFTTPEQLNAGFTTEGNQDIVFK